MEKLTVFGDRGIGQEAGEQVWPAKESLRMYNTEPTEPSKCGTAPLPRVVQPPLV